VAVNGCTAGGAAGDGAKTSELSRLVASTNKVTICNHSRMPKLIPLDRTAHQGLRVVNERAYSACRETTICPVLLAEIPRLVVEYPIAFTRSSETGKLICVALFGVDPRENLYWRDDRWNALAMPLNILRQPFFAAVSDNSQGAAETRNLISCIDVDNPAVQSAEGERLFDDAGRESPYLRHKLATLAELINGEQGTQEFVARLESLELIRPFQLEFRLGANEPRKISGLLSVDEQKLRALDAATLADLNSRGYLHAIYAMLSSLGHLQILARRSGRVRESTAA